MKFSGLATSSLGTVCVILSHCGSPTDAFSLFYMHDDIAPPTVTNIVTQQRSITATTTTSSIASVSKHAIAWLFLLPPPANAASTPDVTTNASPPTNAEIQLLRSAFAAFYGTSRDATAALPLLTQSIDAWQRQPYDEQAGLYRVRGDCYMALLKPSEAIQDYTTAIQYLQKQEESKGNADPSELPASILGRARAIRSLSTTATKEQALQGVKDYETALKMSSREEWDTEQELLEDGARTNPYAAWEYGMALRHVGMTKEANAMHILASQYFEDIGDPARSFVSMMDAGIDAADYDPEAAKNVILKKALPKIKLVEGRDIPLLQRVIAKEGEGRVALASIYWTSTSSERQEAESQLGLACQRLDQLEADAIARQRVNPIIVPNKLKFNIDDGPGALDMSCSRLKNKEFQNERLEWPVSLQEKAAKLYSLSK